MISPNPMRLLCSQATVQAAGQVWTWAEIQEASTQRLTTQSNKPDNNAQMDNIKRHKAVVPSCTGRSSSRFADWYTNQVNDNQPIARFKNGDGGALEVSGVVISSSQVYIQTRGPTKADAAARLRASGI